MLMVHRDSTAYRYEVSCTMQVADRFFHLRAKSNQNLTTLYDLVPIR
jgi:hypothetical protein